MFSKDPDKACLSTERGIVRYAPGMSVLGSIVKGSPCFRVHLRYIILWSEYVSTLGQRQLKGVHNNNKTYKGTDKGVLK